MEISDPDPERLDGSMRRRIFLYLGALILLLGFGAPSGGLIALPVSFFLKNRLHLSAHDVAIFGLLSSIPAYLSVAFGFARDTWNPLGRGDRGLMILFGGLSAVIYAICAFMPPTYGVLLTAFLVLNTSFLFVASAVRGLTSTIGQQHVMTGQISAIWNTFEYVPVIAALVAGGMLSDMLEGSEAAHGARELFLIGAAIMLIVTCYGFWKPGFVFDNVKSERRLSKSPLNDVGRLFRHWPIYPALLVWLLWNFVPGLATPLQYYFQNTLHGTDSQYGQWQAIYYGAFIPSFLLFGVLCRRYALKSLLYWGTAAALPMMLPLLLIHSVTGALLAAGLMGLLGGVPAAAYLDLIIRSCPKGLQGTVLMASVGLTALDARFGDLLGTALYDHFGTFAICVGAMTLTNSLILVSLLLVPNELMATADGETSPTDTPS